MKYYCLSVLILTLLCGKAQAQTTAAQVSAMGWHTSGDIVYKKTVVDVSPQSDVFWNVPREEDTRRGDDISR